MDNLTPYQKSKIVLWNRAEAYIRDEQTQQFDPPNSGGQSLSESYY